VLAGVGLAGLAGAVTACGAGGSSGAPASQGTSPASQAASTGPAPLAPTSDIPVGGGTIFTGPKVVVTQPTAGDFKAFSAVCTHMGCLVSQVSNGTIDCPCHGSQYSITTGAVVAGPAPKPLAPEHIKVNGGSIFLE
jgi:Rieske Fe-S protein